MTESVKPVLDQWVESLGQVLESMTDTRPELVWKKSDSVPGDDEEVVWWEQSFQYPVGAKVWVAAPRGAWEPAGTLTLRAAGLDTVEPSEARNTWVEILGQSLGALARAIGKTLGRQVNSDASVERAPSGELGAQAAVEIRIAGNTLAPVTVVLSQELVENLAAPQPVSVSGGETEATAAPATRQRSKNSPTLDLLLDIDLPVSISFGSAQLPLKEVVKLNTGSIVELDRLVGEPVEVLVNQRLIARGEVVVVDGNYGVRIQEIVSQKERLRSIQ